MNVSELIKILEQVKFYNPDARVLTSTTIGTLVEATRIGTVKVLPVVPGSKADKRPYNRRLLPGNEWRMPINSKDEGETIREIHFLIAP